MGKKMSKKNILDCNPKIDQHLTQEIERLEAQLSRIGVHIKPSFRLEHPLGGVINKSKW